jgi:signal recognition particle GTPase
MAEALAIAGYAGALIKTCSQVYKFFDDLATSDAVFEALFAEVDSFAQLLESIEHTFKEESAGRKIASKLGSHASPYLEAMEDILVGSNRTLDIVQTLLDKLESDNPGFMTRFTTPLKIYRSAGDFKLHKDRLTVHRQTLQLFLSLYTSPFVLLIVGFRIRLAKQVTKIFPPKWISL